MIPSVAHDRADSGHARSGVAEDGDRPLDVRHLVIDGFDKHPSQANGLHNVARRLAREQIAAGDSARIVFLRPPELMGAIETHGVATELLPLVGTAIAGRPIRLAPGIAETILKGAGPDTIFHIHAGRQPLLVGIGRMLDRRGIPYGLTVHGRYSHVFDAEGRAIRRLPALYLRTIERRVLEGARFVQAITRAEHDIIRRVAPHARVELIPNAAWSSRLDGAPPPPARPGPSASFPLFGFCGRYELEHKGIDLLLEGFAVYRRAGGRGRLALIGSGPGRERIAAMVSSLALEAAVEVHGPRFGEDKAKALESWDFFALPSRYDVLPTACLEAALYGLPLIVSVETGLVEHITQHGAGIPVRSLSATAVAEALLEADRLSSDEWRGMSRNVHGMALAIGDWTAIAAQLRTLYRRA